MLTLFGCFRPLPSCRRLALQLLPLAGQRADFQQGGISLGDGPFSQPFFFPTDTLVSFPSGDLFGELLVDEAHLFLQIADRFDLLGPTLPARF